MPARVIMLRRRILANDMLARRVGVFVGVLMTMSGGGSIVVMVGVVMCNVAGSRRTMMDVGFSRHYGLGGERSNGQHKGQERYEGAPPFPTICPQPQHFFAMILRGHLDLSVPATTVAHKKPLRCDETTSVAAKFRRADFPRQPGKGQPA